MKKRAPALAIDGGPKAFGRRTGKAGPKIGVAEFLSVAERFGFTPAALKRLRRAVTDRDLAAGGPHLGRYWGSPAPPKGEALEALARRTFHVKQALSVSSGTGALHAAFVAVGVGPGAEVICPALGFAATAMAVVMAGGVPVFCDVDESLQIDPRKIEPLITPRTVALAPTHHWGNVVDMDPVLEVARRRGLRVVEDCAQSPGARYRGRPVGTLGDMGCFSISAYKIIGGGEGGLVVTNDRRLFERACQLAEGGGLWREPRFGPPRWEGELFAGTNYRMSELEAAVDVVQLGRLREVVRRHQRVSRRVRRRLGCYDEITPQKINDAAGAIGYALRFFPRTADLSRRIAAALQAEGIGAWTRGTGHAPDWHLARDMFPVVLRTGHVPGGSVFEDPRYLARGGRADYRPGMCPVAEDLFAREVSVWIDPAWSDADSDAVAAGINKVLSAYCTRRPGEAAWL